MSALTLDSFLIFDDWLRHFTLHTALRSQACVFFPAFWLTPSRERPVAEKGDSRLPRAEDSGHNALFQGTCLRKQIVREVLRVPATLVHGLETSPAVTCDPN